VLLGINYFGQQEYGQAADHLTKATTLAPDFAPAYNQLGYAQRFLGQYDKAEATFKRYVELIPDDPNPYDSYAELLLKIGRFQESIDNYRKALTHNADFPASYIGIAAAMMYEGKYAEARQELQTALRRARTDGERRGALFTRAVTYVDEGRFAEALAEMDSQFVMGQRINDPAAMAGDLVAMGNILLEAGKSDEASAKFEKATALIQQSSLADAVKENNALFNRYNTARVAIARGDLVKAAEDAATLRERAEARGNKVQIRLAHEVEGMIALAQGDAAKAIVELQNASQQNPYNLYRLAVAWQTRGDTAKARELATAAAQFYGLPLMNYGFIRKKAETMLASL
jgi:tetratricopeptide (TPR) repeat protein